MIQQPARLTPRPPEKPAPRRSALGSGVQRAGIVVAVCLALAVPVVLAIGSAPAPVTPAAGASGAPTTAIGEKAEPSWPPKANAKAWPGGPGSGFKDGSGHGPITITAISGSSVSLATQDGWKRTITVTPDTKITKGGQTIGAGDLKVGDEVRFTQKRNADGTYTITAIVVPTPVTAGEVTAVNGSTITIKKRDSSTQVITVTSSTVYTLGKASGSKADVRVGVDLTAQGTVDGSTFTALSVRVALAHATGQVTAVTGSTITIKKRNSSTQDITVTSSTVYTLGKASGSKSDVTVGVGITVDGTLDGSTFTALSVRVALAHATGTVTEKTSSAITIKDRGGATTVIHVSSSTTFKVRGKDAATIADIAVGDRVQVDGTRRSDGSIGAIKVSASTPKGDKGAWPKASPTPSTPSS